MKQLGPNLWWGEREMISNYKIYSGWMKEKEREELAELEGRTPSNRFWYFARKEFNCPWKNIDDKRNYFRMHEYGLLELDHVRQQSFPDLKNCSDFLIQVRTLYVVDLQQGKGIGRRILEDIKKVSEKSSCAVILFACPYGFDSGNGKEMGVLSWDELVRVALEEARDVVYLSKLCSGSIKDFYKQAGFQNICLRGPFSRPVEEGIDQTQYEFIYIPQSISKEYREELTERLKIQLSRFCQCKDELIA